MADAAILITFEATALLFIALGVPLLLRKVPPNLLYGFRTSATLKDERVWYDVNARAGADMIGVGVVLAVLAPVLAGLCSFPGQVALGCAAWLLAGTVFMVVHGMVRIRELKRTR